MKTWEMIKELTENPSKKFKRVGDGLEVMVDIDNGLIWRSGYSPFNINHVWEEIKEPVLFMGLNEYQELASRTIPEDKDNLEKLKEFTMALNEEAGEATSPIKKYLFHGHGLNREKVVEELGDVLWHIGAIAKELAIGLEEIGRTNIDKLRKRYPEGFSQEKSIHREG